jgi:hypothetical protein
MAEKLSETHPEESIDFLVDLKDDDKFSDVEELKSVLMRMKSIEEQAEEVISRIENKK